jgi:hypothetical protein
MTVQHLEIELAIHSSCDCYCTRVKPQIPVVDVFVIFQKRAVHSFYMAHL